MGRDVYLPVFFFLKPVRACTERMIVVDSKQTRYFFSLLNFTISGRCLLLQRYFCKDYHHGQKADVSKGYWNVKTKMCVINHAFFRNNYDSKKDFKY